MNDSELQSYSAFEGTKLLAQGPLEKVILKVSRRSRLGAASTILIFSDTTGKEMDFDLRGSEREILQRLQTYLSPGPPSVRGGPGRPKLGVVAREVSLLPRHWEWLSTQSGGASATLRRLVDEAKRNSSSGATVKEAQERTYKFMTAIAGNLANYEEAIRALFAKDRKKFFKQIADWPKDIREHAKRMADAAFAAEGS